MSGDNADNMKEKSEKSGSKKSGDDVNMAEEERVQRDPDYQGDEESEGDFMYVDDAFLQEMDKDAEESDDDFRTMKESDIGSEFAGDFQDGDICEVNLQLENDCVC